MYTVMHGCKGKLTFSDIDDATSVFGYTCVISVNEIIRKSNELSQLFQIN